MLPIVKSLQQLAPMPSDAPPEFAGIENKDLLPSGIFVQQERRSLNIVSVCNPFFTTTPNVDQLVLAPSKNRDLRKEFGAVAEIPGEHIDHYAHMIAQVRAHFTLEPTDAVIVPLCGALRPASLILPMGNFDLKMLPIPFTRGSSGTYDTQIMSVLGESLAPLYNRDPLQLAVLDTGEGGQSLQHLAKLLRQLHDESAPHSLWDVHFRIIISADNMCYLDETNGVKDMQSERFQISREVFPTKGLPGNKKVLGEDIAPAIGYSVDWGNPGAGFIQPNEHYGALALRFPDRIEITRSDNLSKTVDDKLANAVTKRLQTDPDACFMGNIWDPFFGYTLPKDPFSS